MNFKITADRADIALTRTKNTFKQKSKNALDIVERNYYRSLHYEAKSRLAYIKFEKAEKELAEIKFDWSPKSFLKTAKNLIKIANCKMSSISNETNAYSSFPERFLEADNPSAHPHRYYTVFNETI